MGLVSVTGCFAAADHDDLAFEQIAQEVLVECGFGGCIELRVHDGLPVGFDLWD